MGKLTLALGFGAGYVLGAKAGTQRYEEIMAKARELAGKPAVQDATSRLSQTASSVAESAKAKANQTVEKVGGTSGSTASSAPSTTSTLPPPASTSGLATDPVVDLTTTGTPATSATAPLASTATTPVTPAVSSPGPIPGAAASDTV